MNYLLTLAQRTLDAEPEIRPVLPTAFEPVRQPPAPGSAAVPVDRVTPAPPDKPRSTDQARPSQRPALLPIEWESAVDHPSRAAPMPTPGQAATAVSDVEAPARRATPRPEPLAAPAQVAVSPGEEPVRVVVRPAAVARLPVDQPGPTGDERGAPVIFPRRAADLRAATETAMRRVTAQPAAEPPTDRATPPQTIHVHIGRVEVRATPPAAQTARPAPAPPAARRTALEAYLAGQSGGAS